jgi:hypothetical protein
VVILTGSEVLGNVATLVTALELATGLIKKPNMSLKSVVLSAAAFKSRLPKSGHVD